MAETGNYQLNQWESADRIMMEDFNADNAKIDAALAAEAAARVAGDAATPYVKLIEVTLLENTAQWDVDFSGIDVTQYALLYCFPDIKSSSDSILIRFDNQSGSSDYYSSGNPKDNAGWIGSKGRGRIDIQYANGDIYITAQTITSLGIRSETFSKSNYNHANGEGFLQINFVLSSGTIYSGSTVTLYGLKK